MRRLRLQALTVLLLTVFARAGWAQEVGTVAGLDGSAEIGRAGVWTAATVGAAVHVQDELRTGRPGRVRVVLRDDSVLNIGDDSHLAIDEQIFDPAAGNYRTVIRLLKGKVRPLVSEYYQRPNAVYEIETPTAVVRVRSTEFVITYDPVADTSEVVGVTGRVNVHSTQDRVGHAVLVSARQITTVARGKFPTAPRDLPDKLFRQYIEGLEFIGGGQQESLAGGDPLLSGARVPPPDQADASAGPPAAAALRIVPTLMGESPFESRSVSDIVGQPPLSIQAPGDLGIRF